MEKKKVNKGGVSAGAIAGGVATVAALSAAAYVMFGPDAKKNRKVIKGWAVKMKGEIIENLEKAKDITEPVYHNIIDKVSSKYAKAKDMNQEELEALVKDVKKHWKTMTAKSKAKPRAKK
jgi:hypothetical protein